ncbi:17904_t:CDS:1, partial [Gigaspora margarita]
IKQEHSLTSTGHQFSSPTSSYIIEESLQIQSNFVHDQEYIDTIYAMSNNYMHIDFSSTSFSPNNYSSSSIASNLDYL